MYQIDIFDIEEEKEKNEKIDTFIKLLNQLESYGIDERYRNEHKGKQHTFRVISNDLCNMPKYKEYQKKLLKILQGYFKDNDEVDVIYYEDYDYIRMFEPNQSYPLYCLEMLNVNIL